MILRRKDGIGKRRGEGSMGCPGGLREKKEKFWTYFRFIRFMRTSLSVKCQPQRKCLITICNQGCYFLDNYDTNSLFCEGLGPTDTWLKYCRTAGKPSGKRIKQASTCGIWRNRSTQLKNLACLLPVFSLQVCLVGGVEVALEHDQFRVLVEGLPAGNRYTFLFNIT